MVSSSGTRAARVPGPMRAMLCCAQGPHKSPMQYIQEAEPILVEGPVVASTGSDDPSLGCPVREGARARAYMHARPTHDRGAAPTRPACPPSQVEYINLKGTSREKPAVCKYTGNKCVTVPAHALGGRGTIGRPVRE